MSSIPSPRPPSRCRARPPATTGSPHRRAGKEGPPSPSSIQPGSLACEARVGCGRWWWRARAVALRFDWSWSKRLFLAPARPHLKIIPLERSEKTCETQGSVEIPLYFDRDLRCNVFSFFPNRMSRSVGWFWFYLKLWGGILLRFLVPSPMSQIVVSPRYAFGHCGPLWTNQFDHAVTRTFVH